ncbi:hypothetical protein C8J56DRAFT_1089113 [Mycena floridula]|nr:hypothetical protein C8J56DRAFT_1089113 [Mycena floridula]
MPVSEEAALAALIQASHEEIEQYKCWLGLGPDLACLPFFSLANAVHSSAGSTPVPTPPEEPSQGPSGAQKCPRASQATVVPNDFDIIDISSSDDESHVQAPAKRIKIKRGISPVPSSQPAPAPWPKVPKEHVLKSISPQFPCNPEGKIIITQKEKVDEVVHMNYVPERWPVASPGVDTAYIVDLTGDDSNSEDNKNLDRMIKGEDHDSWGKGTNGSSTSQKTKVKVLDNLETKRSSHRCNGALTCEYFHHPTLDNYQCLDPEDLSATQSIFAAELKQNRLDSESPLAQTASLILQDDTSYAMQKERLSGKAYTVGPLNEGKSFFVGCSLWKKTKQYDHRYAQIPTEDNETILQQYINGSSLKAEEVAQYSGACSRFRHPHHRKQKLCTHVHFRDNKLVPGNMVARECPVQKIVYTVTNSKARKALVIFWNTHNHPPWPEEKVTVSAQKDLTDCITETSVFGMTAERLNNDSTTRVILGSTLSAKHAAFQDKRKMGDNVRKIKKASAPEGLSWAVVMNGSLKVAVTMEPELAELIHSTRYIVLDYTFKRTHGELNEWEVVVRDDETKTRYTIGRVYCNSATQEAFTTIFEEYFMTVAKVTNRPVRFKAFHPNSGNLYAVLVDMEAAQVQGLRQAIRNLKMNDPAISGIDTNNPDELVQYILKLCYLHLERGADKLVSEIGKEGVDYLLRIRGINNKEDLKTWQDYCKDHVSKGVRDWYNHKIKYPWLLGGFNQMLSKMPDGYWAQSPSHTNLVESAHTATNKATGIGLTLVEAVTNAHKYDRQAAAKLRTAHKSCILQNANNTDKDRWHRSISRASHAYQRGREHSELDIQIATLHEEVHDQTQQKKEKQAQLKSLLEQKRGKGKSPRHSKTSTPSSSSSIPKVHGKRPEREEIHDKADIENEPVSVEPMSDDYSMLLSSPLMHPSVPLLGSNVDMEIDVDVEMNIFQTLANTDDISNYDLTQPEGISLEELYAQAISTQNPEEHSQLDSVVESSTSTKSNTPESAWTTDKHGLPFLPMPRPTEPEGTTKQARGRRGPRVEVDPRLELPAGSQRQRKEKQRIDKDWVRNGK